MHWNCFIISLMSGAFASARGRWWVLWWVGISTWSCCKPHPVYTGAALHQAARAPRQNDSLFNALKGSCCYMVNDDPLTPKAKQAYRQAARVLLETVLTQRLRRSGDTTGLNSEWLEEKALPIYHVLVINRLYGDSSHRFLSDLYLHHTPDSVPKGRVYTQLTLGFVDNAQGWHLDYTFAFRPTDTTTTYHTQRWRQWFHYCEDNGAQPLEVLDSADIPTLLVAERRALSARELRASANQ